MGKIPKSPQTVFNTRVISPFILAIMPLLMLMMGDKTLPRGGGESSVLGLILLSLVGVGCMLFMPVEITFTKKEIRIFYLIGKTEIIPRKKIRSIALTAHPGVRGVLPTYTVFYDREGKRPFYMTGQLPKTRRVRQVLEMYWRKGIY